METPADIISIIEANGGMVRTRDLTSRQYHILLDMVASGEVNRIGRGLYATDEALAETGYDIEKIIPGGILCSYSAWVHYGLTTQIPMSVCVAVPRGRKIILPDYPPITLYHQSEEQLLIGKTSAIVNGHEVRIFDLERCVCDAIKYRNKIGMDVCSEILQTYIKKKGIDLNKLTRYAKQLRVGNILHTYLQALL
ncbi:MAG: type IV toxin-antitoxin system AbiEi family antitoxin domain-containing protein [Paramuribaculum sp.]|nr:type IV toxin-antitoxin system AbiEi family antitoxin domain-containing protein [Paramuribaculum sp.]